MSTETITQESAAAELARYREQYPDAPPEIAAVGLLRRATTMREVRAVLAAVDATFAAENHCQA